MSSEPLSSLMKCLSVATSVQLAFPGLEYKLGGKSYEVGGDLSLLEIVDLVDILMSQICSESDRDKVG